jgi:hypothetical protein
MVIQNGKTTSVHYFGDKVSPGEKAALDDLERATNESLYVADLQALKRQYTSDEGTMQIRRNYIQRRDYGVSSTASSSSSFASPAAYGGQGFVSPAWPYNYGGWGNGFGGVTGSTSETVSRGLGVGMGDEGRMKDAFAPVIAQQATPEYAAAASRGYQTAMANVARYDNLAKALNAKQGQVALVSYEQDIVVTLKGGKTVQGTEWSENGQWVVVREGAKSTMVPRSEVEKIEATTKGGVRPITPK